jgi:hypothetical protein
MMTEATGHADRQRFPSAALNVCDDARTQREVGMANEKKAGGKTKDEIEANESDEPIYVTLEYDDGTIVESEVMGIFDVGDKEYIALIPDDGSDDVYIYGYKESDKNEDDFELIDIEDDAEFEAAVAAFDEIMAD